MKRKLLYLVCILCFFSAAISGWKLYQELKPQIEAEQFYEEVRSWAFADARQVVDEKEGEVFVSPDFEALLAWNSDIKGWIYAPGTDINYPIVQGETNDFYLNHTVDGNKSIIGSIFMERKNNGDFQDDVTVLYGHHIRGGRMFSSISGYKKQDYYEAHPVIILYTPQIIYQVELFASQFLEGQTDSFPLIFEHEDQRTEWLDKLKAESTFQSPVYPEAGERILALCTCSYEFQDARYVVYGVMREFKNEE